MYETSAAVVGAGFIGPVHVEALRRLGVPIMGILGVDRAESESAAEALGLPKAYGDFDEVLADKAVGAVLFRFAGGARGSLWVSQVTAGRKNRICYEIAGSKCALAWDSESPNELWIGRRERANECLLRDPALVGETPRRFVNYPGGHNEGFPDAFKQCFRAFYDWIAAADPAAEPLYPTFQQGHHEVVLCEAILKSHRQQKWIPL
jgi:predicted dehydrogenase